MNSINWGSTLASAAVGGVAGFASARLQDYLRKRQRTRALAGTLASEVARIRSELGKPADKYTETHAFGLVPVIPLVHRWLERVVIEAADLTPFLVRDFLDLDRSLANLTVYVDKLRDVTLRRRELEEHIRAAKQSNTPLVADGLRHDLEPVADEAAFFNYSAVEERKRATACLDRIQEALRKHGQ